MTGPKLNARSFVAGERSGTKASARYVRTSASKARAVLDLIRGLDVRSADEVLYKTVIIKGVMAIQSGDNPRIVEQKLRTFLPPNERKAEEKEAA